MVNVSTHFTGAQIVRSQSLVEIFKAIRMMWMLVYFGPPHVLDVDQGKNYTSSDFKRWAMQDFITIKEAPIETPAHRNGGKLPCVAAKSIYNNPKYP